MLYYFGQLFIEPDCSFFRWKTYNIPDNGSKIKIKKSHGIPTPHEKSLPSCKGGA